MTKEEKQDLATAEYNQALAAWEFARMKFKHVMETARDDPDEAAIRAKKKYEAAIDAAKKEYDEAMNAIG